MSMKKGQYDSHVKALLAHRMAETAKLMIDFDTDPETALLDDACGPPDINRTLDACAAGAVQARDRTLSEDPKFVRIGREYIDQCFEWRYGKTTSEYAAECELKAENQLKGNSRYEKIKQELARKADRELSHDNEIDR